MLVEKSLDGSWFAQKVVPATRIELASKQYDIYTPSLMPHTHYFDFGLPHVIGNGEIPL